ncbi:non-ribosomal peptide synthetase [Caldalkalibacillus mannanilyticus]|uniref:non-ribosomal peptide synthetase n=1 Tax=Caldalkalibacillus mannanilyticus TaxID=1418 RepID=UPI00046A2C31|nr:non-ribosomal peptide synthetase [Caldalkalibacillus mannanilyticus]
MNGQANDHRFPLTHPQKRIWYIEKLYPDTPLHHICGRATIEGKIDRDLLEKAILLVINKNEAFRLRFYEEGETFYQRVSDIPTEKIDFIDFSQFENSEECYLQWINNEIEKPFSLTGDTPLFYFALYKKRVESLSFFAKIHHLVFDGWSMQIVTEQICYFYEQLMRGQNTDDSFVGSYLSSIEQEQLYLKSERFLKNKAYWMNTFETLPEPIFQEGSIQLEGKRQSFFIEESLSQKIKAWTEEHQCSLSDWYVMLFQLYLHKWTGHQDIVVGIPVYNRSGKTEKQTIGMFTSTMPLRCNVNVKESVIQHIKKLRKEIRRSYTHQKYPYDLLIQDLHKLHQRNEQLFQCSINYYNFKPNHQLMNSPMASEELYNGYQLYPLHIVIKDWSEQGSVQLEFDYQTSVFTDQQMKRMFERFILLANQILDDPHVAIHQLTLLSEKEKNQLLDHFNQTRREYPANKTTIQLFEEQVKRSPERIAVSCKNETLTYHQLHLRSNQLARFLQQRGIGRGQMVGLFVNHSIDLIVAILGVLKTGAAYVPIDVHTAPKRIQEMLDDSEATGILVNQELPKEVEYRGIIIHLHQAEIYQIESSNLPIASQPNDLVYMMYTSGSTGMPKGVMIEQRGLVNYICWAVKTYIRGEKETFALYSSLAFDLTVTSIFAPLISGNQIRIYEENDDDFVLYDILQENRVTMIKLTPAHLSLLQDRSYSNSSVRKLIVGGEELKSSLAQKIYENFSQQIEIYNEYGPTETVVGCMIHTYNPATDTNVAVPIGVPADNVQIYLLDEELNPVPHGCVGEIYISGDGVARGYWKQPELTAQRFVDHPFLIGQKMYRTGDLAKFLEGDIVEYLGRKDHQVKLRGYRIELGEIEYRLLQLEGIKEAVVLDVEVRSDQKQLCAYLVKKLDVEVSVLTVKQELMKVLPSYMIPTYFLFLDQIPLTSNGKINRSQLALPSSYSYEEERLHDLSNDQHVEQVIKLFQEVLQVDEISIHADFYQLGGDSIKAIQLASKLKDQGWNIRAKDILTYSTIADILSSVEPATDDSIISQELAEGEVPYSSIASWFFAQSFTQTHHFNQSVLLQLSNGMEVDHLESILHELIRHHDTLRLNVDFKQDKLFYNPGHLHRPFTLKKVDLSSLPYEIQCKELERVGYELKSTMDLEKDLLFRACMFDLGPQGRRLLLTAHHLIIDGVSWRILLADLLRYLEGSREQQAIFLGKKTHSYQYWVEQLISYTGQLSEREAEYWNSIEPPSTSWFPLELPSESSSFRQASIADQLDVTETEALLTKANEAFQTEPVELLLTSLALSIQEFSNLSSMCIELEGHGREEFIAGLDLSRTVGWFTSMYPIQLAIEGETLSSQIKSIKEQVRRVPNKGFDYLPLKYIAKALKKDHHLPIRFNYLGDFGGLVNQKFFTMAEEATGADIGNLNPMTSMMDVIALIVNQRLQLTITYNQTDLNTETISLFMKRWIDYLRMVIEHCMNQQHIEFTPSDFETLELSQEELDILFQK